MMIRNGYRCFRPSIAAATISIGAFGWTYDKDSSLQSLCESPFPEKKDMSETLSETKPSIWFKLLAPFGILSPSLPRLLTPNDPAFQIPKRFLRKRQDDEEKVRQLLTRKVPARNDPQFDEKMERLREEICQLMYGRRVTAQMREDFIVRFGCTGFNAHVLQRIVNICHDRGVVEIFAGHGQWQKALTNAYSHYLSHNSDDDGEFSELAYLKKKEEKKKLDFVLAYDDFSNLPLNTHIYNQYTQPHHNYFGTVQKLESDRDFCKVLRSWACRGRALLLVYPPPGPMAAECVQTYIDAAPNNDTLIYVGEGRGGANGDDYLFDILENGEWMLKEVIEVVKPPGDKGCEKLYVCSKLLPK